MNTTEALKQAMQAVKDAGIPEELWPTALPLALADLRGISVTPAPTGSSNGGNETATRAAKKRARKLPSPAKPDDGGPAGVFEKAASEADFLDRVARQTETSAEDLRDVFHVEKGELHLKVLSKDLGDNDKAKTMTVTALMGGAVFAGTDVPSIPFSEIHRVCKTMRCFSDKHAAEYIRETPGFGSIGSSRSSALTHKNGWETEFAKAVVRVLKKTETSD